MLLNKRERAIQRVYEAAVAALKRRRDRNEIGDATFLAGCRQLYGAYERDMEAEHMEHVL